MLNFGRPIEKCTPKALPLSCGHQEAEALAAKNSPEAILGSRFITTTWLRDELPPPRRLLAQGSGIAQCSKAHLLRTAFALPSARLRSPSAGPFKYLPAAFALPSRLPHPTRLSDVRRAAADADGWQREGRAGYVQGQGQREIRRAYEEAAGPMIWHMIQCTGSPVACKDGNSAPPRQRFAISLSLPSLLPSISPSLFLPPPPSCRSHSKA